MKIRDDGGLLTCEMGGEAYRLGYLVPCDGSVFDPNVGRVDVTLAAAERHNGLLSEIEVAGLDSCNVGEGLTLYLIEIPGGEQVQTWTGRHVATAKKMGALLVFRRGTRHFVGTPTKKHPGCAFFERVA